MVDVNMYLVADRIPLTQAQIGLQKTKGPVITGPWRVAWINQDVLKRMNGGETGIRTLDTLRYTRFPSVRLQPLGHLSAVLAGLFES